LNYRTTMDDLTASMGRMSAEDWHYRVQRMSMDELTYTMQRMAMDVLDDIDIGKAIPDRLKNDLQRVNASEYPDAVLYNDEYQVCQIYDYTLYRHNKETTTFYAIVRHIFEGHIVTEQYGEFQELFLLPKCEVSNLPRRWANGKYFDIVSWTLQSAINESRCLCIKCCPDRERYGKFISSEIELIRTHY
jgi:hypothetical protein